VEAAEDDFHQTFGQATAAITYQQFYKAIFTTVHTLYPGHNAAGYFFFLEAVFEQWTARSNTRPLFSSI